MKKTILSFISVLCLSFTSLTFALEGDDIVGCWITADGESRIEIFEKERLYFGRIVALKKPEYKSGEVEGMAGKARVDLSNPDKSLRNRPLMGLVFMTDFSFDDGRWRGGRVYDPRKGKTYRSEMSLAKDDSLRIRGYIGVPWIGRTTVWQRLLSVPRSRPDTQVNSPYSRRSFLCGRRSAGRSTRRWPVTTGEMASQRHSNL